MSAWRRVAHERFPELKNEIDRADSPAALWQELKRELDRSYAQENRKLIRAIHDYAWWMIDVTHSPELAEAAIDELYRPLVQVHWPAEDWDQRRPALEIPQYLAEDDLNALYWEYLHKLVPPGCQREFIAELGIGKPPRS